MFTLVIFTFLVVNGGGASNSVDTLNFKSKKECEDAAGAIQSTTGIPGSNAGFYAIIGRCVAGVSDD
jgi:hypothetical protein